MDRFATPAFPRMLARAVLVLALGGCMTTAPEPAPPGYDYLLALGQASASAGQTRAALDAFERAAAADPARKEPWQRIAQLQLDAGRPVQALAAAEQTLQRDPSDAVANEVFIASGLQVARQTLQRLRAGGATPDAAARAQAQELAGLMGRVFGAETLVSDDLKTRYARRAAEQCKAAQSRLREVELPKPRPDPLDVLGGD